MWDSHKIHQVTLWIACKQVGHFGRVHHRPSTDCQKAVKGTFSAKPNGFVKAEGGQTQSHFHLCSQHMFVQSCGSHCTNTIHIYIPVIVWFNGDALKHLKVHSTQRQGLQSCRQRWKSGNSLICQDTNLLQVEISKVLQICTWVQFTHHKPKDLNLHYDLYNIYTLYVILFYILYFIIRRSMKACMHGSC